MAKSIKDYPSDHGKCTELEILDPIFVMDNAMIHHYNGLRELQISNRREFLYLPAYSPFLNPIENVFSKWKNFVIRGTATNEAELKELIRIGFNDISNNDCDSFYRKMLSYLIKCDRREVIIE